MRIVGIWRQLLFSCKIWILFLFYALKLLKKGPHYSRSDIIPGEKFFNMVCNKPNFNQGKTLCRFYLATFLGKWNKTVEAKSDMFYLYIFWHFVSTIANYMPIFFVQRFLKWDFSISAVTINHTPKISHLYFHWYFYQNTSVCMH